MHQVYSLVNAGLVIGGLFCAAGCSRLTDASGKSDGLRIAQAGTERAYFTYNGKPLLSFGGLSDYTFYAAQDVYDYKLWADWAAEHGINHVRAYPSLNYREIEQFNVQNGGSMEQALFPYRETTPGSRQFDLRRFDDAWWRLFREKCEYYQSRGIIIHLLMWSFHIRQGNWDGSMFNPANNINAWTDQLSSENGHGLHAVKTHPPELLDTMKAWYCKLIEATHDLGNVYFDMVHELHPRYDNWEDAQQWIDLMATTIRNRWAELEPERPIILGMDAGKMPGFGFPDDQHMGMPEPGSRMDWMCIRPYFDIIIYGRSQFVENAVNWRGYYNKPYIGQECFAEDGDTYSYRVPGHRVHIRKYLWRFLMAKCQQMDVYMKPRPNGSRPKPPDFTDWGDDEPKGFAHNYDPRGWNKFEDDALVLRRFWDSLADYPNLWFEGTMTEGPGKYWLALSSKTEAILYCSSGTGEADVAFEAGPLRCEGLALNDGQYRVEFVKPDHGIIKTQYDDIRNGVLELDLPAFTDDMVLHIIE